MFRVGHPSYQGRNRSAWHSTYAAALSDMLSRQVTMRDVL
jgi:hypothetical protein